MAVTDKKISELQEASSILNDDYFVVARGRDNYKVPGSLIDEGAQAASEVTFTPVVGIDASDVQAAIEKVGSIDIVAHTVGTTLDASDIEKLHTEEGAVGVVQLYLPTPVVGKRIAFLNTGSAILSVRPQSGFTVRVGSTSYTADHSFRAELTGCTMVLIGTSSTEYVMLEFMNEWRPYRHTPPSGYQNSIYGDDVLGKRDINFVDKTLSRAELKDYAETVNIDTDSGATHTIDLESGNVHELTLTENCEPEFVNPPASGKSGSFTLILKQDDVGSRTVTWPITVKWDGGTIPTLSTAANAIDVFTFFTIDGGTTWYGFVAGQAMA